MRILVCGGRNFSDRQKLHDVLNDIVPRTPEDRYGNWLPANVTIIHGAAPGADSLADDYAIANWCAVAPYPANWERDGRAAGPIRNQLMLDHGKPDLVVAFPGGKGTADMVRRARKAGVEVREIRANAA